MFPITTIKTSTWNNLLFVSFDITVLTPAAGRDMQLSQLSYLFLWFQLLRIEAVEQQGQEEVQNHEVTHNQSRQEDRKACFGALWKHRHATHSKASEQELTIQDQTTFKYGTQQDSQSAQNMCHHVYIHHLNFNISLPLSKKQCKKKCNKIFKSTVTAIFV